MKITKGVYYINKLSMFKEAVQVIKLKDTTLAGRPIYVRYLDHKGLRHFHTYYWSTEDFLDHFVLCPKYNSPLYKVLNPCED